MFRRSMRIMLTLILVFSMLIPSVASADLGNLDLFDISKLISPITVKENSDGTLTIKWTDSSNRGPYEVWYALYPSESVKAFHWVAEERTYAKSCTTEFMVPGNTYEIAVRTSSGTNLGTYIYTLHKPSFYNQIGTQMYIEPQIRTYGSAEGVGRFSSSDIMRNYSWKDYGMYIQLTYSQLAYARHYRYLFAITAPNGMEMGVYSGTLDLPSGRSRLSPWKFISLDSFFDTLRKFYEEIPIGNYTITLYYDGTPITTKTFYVGG